MSSYLSRYAIDTGAYVPPGTSNVGPQVSGGYNCVYGTSGVRFTDVDNNAGEIGLWDDWYQEQIAMYGQRINYYINGYNLSAHDFFYGEMPLLRYAPPISMIMALTLSNDNVILSKFGIQGEADLNAMVHIGTFYATVTANNTVLSAAYYEPKAGDLIELVEYGSTRPGGRSGRVFEITERVDEKGGQNNQLMGHYVWMLQAKRFGFDYELDAPREALMGQVYDNIADGVQNSPPIVVETKDYEQYIDKSSRTIFDYSQNPQSNASVYGSYDEDDTLINLIANPPLSGVVGSQIGSKWTYVCVNSDSNYSGANRETNHAANIAAIQAFSSAVTTYNPSLSSLVVSYPVQKSNMERHATYILVTDLATLTPLLSTMSLVYPPSVV